MFSPCTATMKFDGNINAPFQHLLKIADQEISSAKADLPGELRERLKRVTVVLEEFPSEEHLATGVKDDQLGLFDGPDMRDSESPLVPTITIWLGNIWEMCDANEGEFREEVRVTFLHELGHFLGLGEDDLGLRGLE